MKQILKNFLSWFVISLFLLFCEICCYLFYVIRLFKKDKYA
jgi:hypothetical protein